MVHLTVNGEVITSTLDHPFYVQDAGFVGAGNLYIGDKLLDADGNTLLLEDMKVETLTEPVKVYNFQVEDFHTYHVGKFNILVHNAQYDVGKYNELPNEPDLDRHHVPQKAAMKKLDPNYNPETGPAIQVPKVGHTRKGPRGIVSRSLKGVTTVEELIERDIGELLRVYPDIPQTAIDQLRNYKP